MPKLFFKGIFIKGIVPCAESVCRVFAHCGWPDFLFTIIMIDSHFNFIPASSFILPNKGCVDLQQGNNALWSLQIFYHKNLKQMKYKISSPFLLPEG